MRILLGAVALVVSALPLSLTTAGQPAYAADVCHGLAATVLDDGGTGYLDGTEGDDVIVSHGRPVRALGGNDLVCGEAPGVQVDAGPGNDVVDMKHAGGTTTTALGAGADTFIGGVARDVVDGAAPGVPDVDTDTISTGREADVVTSGSGVAPNTDRVATGPGDDTVDIVPTASGGLLALGPGANHLRFLLASAARTSWTVDTNDQVVQHAGGVMAWTGTTARYVVGTDPLQAPGSSVRFLGSGAGERVLLDASAHALRATIRLSGGDDALVVADTTAGRSVYDLGRGRDALAVSGSTVRVDLAARRLDHGTAATTAVVSGVEGLRVTGAVVRVAGRAKRDRITVAACDVRIAGRAGNDVLRRAGDATCASAPNRLAGGPGDDRLVGTSATDDVLVGGTGYDMADGRGGTDTCRTEVTRRC